MDARDMPKLESPFVRKMISGAYVVTPEITPGYAWVFEDPAVLATEKLDGTNISLVVERGEITGVWNRLNRVVPFTGDWRVNKGLVEAAKKGWLPKTDGQHFGELIGPNVNANPYRLDRHLWVPLSWLREHCAYRSFHEHPKTFENLSAWFREGFSLFMRRRGAVQPPEGIVFYRPSTGEMAKLRRDMFGWFTGARHREQARPCSLPF